MRVLLVTHRYPPDGVGGVERYVEALARELTAEGDEVSVLARRPTHLPRRPRLRQEGRVYRIEGSGVRLENPLLHHERLEQLMDVVLEETRPDVVHVNHLIGLSPRTIPLVCRPGIPVVLYLHDYYLACPLVHLQKRTGELCAGPDGGRECAATCFGHEGAAAGPRWGLREEWYRRLLELPAAVLSPSHDLAAYFERHIGGTRRVEVLPYGIWIEPGADGASSARSRRPLRLAFVGSVLPHKGVHALIDALRLAAIGPVRLTLLGQVGDRRYGERLVAEARAVPGLALEVGGGYAPAELPALLRGHDLVVVPSQVREASPLAPREALALGLPVLAARIGGLPELVVEGENGLTFDPFDAGELAALLRRLDGEESLLDRLTRGARETPVRTVSQHVAELREIYADAAAAPSRTAPAMDELFRRLEQVGFARRSAAP